MASLRSDIFSMGNKLNPNDIETVLLAEGGKACVDRSTLFEILVSRLPA
jgi:hypothetical protein